MYARNIHTQDTDRPCHTDDYRQGAAFNSTHIQDSHQTQAQAAESPVPLGLAEAGGH